jgi:TatD DNase family protein
LLNAVPLDKVLLESDGMDSIAWALNQELPLSAYPRIMNSGIQALSQAHHIAPDQVAAQLVENLQCFWAGDSEK